MLVESKALLLNVNWKDKNMYTYTLKLKLHSCKQFTWVITVERV